MTQPLITAEQHAQLLAVGEARATGQSIDPMPVVRLFTPDAHATWLLAALDPTDGDTAYGLIDLGIGMPALGTVKLSDLAAIVGPCKRPVMRDSYFNLRGNYRNTCGWRRKTARSWIDASQRSRVKRAHRDYFGLTQDRAGLNPHPCTEAVRF